MIMEKAVSVGLGFSSPERIDEINILQATYEAMREAVSKLSVQPDVLLNDAVTIPGLPMKQVPIIKGDAKSVSIAAASIVAKVTRDRMMVEYDTVFPEYGFASNKGYGAAAHIEALKNTVPAPYTEGALLLILYRSFYGSFCIETGSYLFPIGGTRETYGFIAVNNKEQQPAGGSRYGSNFSENGEKSGSWYHHTGRNYCQKRQ